MAKDTPNKKYPNARPITEQKEEKKGLAAVFENIKNFFKGIRDKLREIFEYNKRIKNGKEDWEGSIEGQANKYATKRPFKTTDQIIEEDVHFPGYNDIKIEHGMVRLPIGTEAIAGWDINDPEKYIKTVTGKFDAMPDPFITRDGAFITSIANDINYAMRKGQEGTLLYVVGKSLIVAEIHDGKCDVTITDGKKKIEATLDNKDQLRAPLAAMYTAHAAPEEITPLHDRERNIMYAPFQRTDGEVGVFITEQHQRHVLKYEENTRFVINKQPLEGLYEISGPGLMGRQKVQELFGGIDMPETSRSDFRYMLTAMHETILDNRPEEGKNISIQGSRSMYLGHDKMYWLSSTPDGFFFNVAPARNNRYDHITTVQIKIPPEAMEPTKDGYAALHKAANYACAQLSREIDQFEEVQEQEAAQQAAMKARQERLQQADDVMVRRVAFAGEQAAENGQYAIMKFQVNGHTVTFHGHATMMGNGQSISAAGITLDGETLFDVSLPDASNDGKITTFGKCESMEAAIEHLKHELGDDDYVTLAEQEPIMDAPDVDKDNPETDNDERVS